MAFKKIIDTILGRKPEPKDAPAEPSIKEAASNHNIGQAASGGSGKEDKKMLDINRVVGPVMQSGEIALAVVEAVREDNAPKQVEVQDRGAYIRISVEDECIITRKTMEETMGRPFKMYEMEAFMSSFNGQIETSTDHIRFYMHGKA